MVDTSRPSPEGPEFANWLKAVCGTSTDPFVRNSEADVARFCGLVRKLPSKYGWRFSSVEAYRTQMTKARTVRDVNRLYWTDQARNVEAYSVMSLWRGHELLRSGVRSLNHRELVAAAVTARSLLEVAASFLLNANIIAKTFEELSFAADQVVVSTEFEERVVKMIWGRRIDAPPDYLKQGNVLTAIQKLTRHPSATELLPKYEYLCELAHPNVIGNMRFWSHVDVVHDDGSEVLVFDSLARSEVSREIAESVLWAMGWSVVSLNNGLVLIQDSSVSLLRNLSEA